MSGSNLLGIQAWIALPSQDDVAADFAHYGSPEIPRICADGIEFTLIAGSSEGLISPVKVFSETIFAEIVLTGGAQYQVKPEHRDRAIYVVAGEVRVIGQPGTFGEAALIALTPGLEVVLQAPAFHAARLMLIGGEPLADARCV
ncbi:Pirin domain-containing protein [Mesorhizobium loti]|nr:Pirin domain-containing protein [Mesorhizobium loti]